MNKISIFKILFNYSIKKLVNNKTFYYLLALNLIFTLAICIFLPLLLERAAGSNLFEYYGSTAWVGLIMQGSFLLCALNGTVISLFNAINEEKVYWLSKPIKRWKFLLAKCLSSFLIGLLETSVLILTLVIITIITYAKFPHSSMYSNKYGINPASIYCSFIGILLFSSFGTTILKYVTTNSLVTVIYVAIILVYVVLYPMFSSMDNSEPSQEANIERFWWLTIPAIASIPILLIGTLVPGRQFLNMSIRL